jgi:uncharacterized protein YndB with AHSA1/START domain
MVHEFEIARDVQVDAPPDKVWEAVATGRGWDSWFMGRNEIEQREGRPGPLEHRGVHRGVHGDDLGSAQPLRQHRRHDARRLDA